MNSMQLALSLKAKFSALSPTVRTDSTDGGDECAELIIENPKNGLPSVSVSIFLCDKLLECSVWLGGACLSDKVSEEHIFDMLSAVTAGEIVTVLGYKNEKAMESGKSNFIRVLDIADEEQSEELEHIKDHLLRPVGILDGITGRYCGIFRVSSFAESQIYKRSIAHKS